MNKTYRTIWSETRGAWMAAPEISSTRGKAGTLSLASIAVALMLAAGLVNSANAQSIGSGVADDTGTAISNTNCGLPGAFADVTAVAIGCGSAAAEGTSPPGTAVPYSNIAIGFNAKAPQVLGAFGSPLRGSNIAIGGSASATGDGARGGDQIAIGNESVAFGADSISIGAQTSARGFQSIVVGGNYSEADTASSNAIVFGIAATALSAPNSVIVGNNSRALAANAVVIGTDSSVDVSNGTALGNATRVANANSVAIGANSQALASQVAVANTIINGNAYAFAGAAPVGTVSFGSAGAERQLTQVAAGQITATSTDGVNGSQLFAAQEAIEGVAIEVDTVNGRVTNIFNTGTKYFHANSTGADSQATGVNSVAIGQGALSSHGGSVALGAGSVADGATLTNGAYLVGGSATGEVNVGNRRLTGVAAGSADTDSANIAQLRRLHDESIRYELNTDGTINFNAITLGGAGGTIIHNVAPGVVGTDAVNLNQLTTATTSIAGKWVTGNPTSYAAPTATGTNSTAVGSGATSSGVNSVALGTNASDGGRANVVSVGSSGSERQVTNVAAGTQNTDAVNLSQLRPVADALGGGTTINVDGTINGPTYNINNIDAAGNTTSNTYNNVGDALGGLSTSVVNLNDAVHNINGGAGIKYFHANSTAPDSTASGLESTSMGPASTASGNSAVAAGDRASASGAGSVAVGQQSVASGASSVAVGQGAQATNVGSVAIGLNSQSTGVNTIAIGTGALATNSVAVGAGAQAGGGGAAFGDGAIALNTGKGTALGNSASVTSVGGVALGAGAVAERGGLAGQREAVSGVAVSSTQGAVSVGSAGNERQITNVAGGTQATDAVNLRQLQASQAGTVRYDTKADGSVNYSNITLGNGEAPNGTAVSNVAPGVEGTDAVNVNQLNQGLANANQYTDSKLGQLRSEIGNAAKDASAGTAGAMALASLPQSTLPGKGMVSAGVAAFDGQAAIAVGVSKLSDNGRWVVKLGGTANSRGKVGVSAGVGFHW